MIKYFLGFILLSVIVFESCFSGKEKYEAIRVRGSDSEVNLVQAIAENYMDNHERVSVGVTGGGSGAGIAALINSKTDLANSSREISEDEKHFAGLRDVNPYEIVFARDALAIIVNADNPADSISLEDLGKIYSGEEKSWAVVGGLDEEITLYGRQSSSGTYIFFRDFVVQNEYDTRMIGMSGTAQIVEAIKKDKKGIGYVSSGYLDESVLENLKVLKVKKDASHLAYSPMEDENIIQGLYPITRPLLQYTDGKPEGTLLDFILYQFSPEGAEIIKSNGFYPVPLSEELKVAFNINQNPQ